MVALESLSFHCTLFGNYQEEQMCTHPFRVPSNFQRHSCPSHIKAVSFKTLATMPSKAFACSIIIN